MPITYLDYCLLLISTVDYIKTLIEPKHASDIHDHSSNVREPGFLADTAKYMRYQIGKAPKEGSSMQQ